MTFQTLNFGSAANDPTADTLFAGSAKIHANALAAFNALRPAESLGFVSGTSLGTEAATNLAAWNSLMASGGFVSFGPGDWDLRFASVPDGILAEVVLRGAGGKRTRFLGGTVVYFTLLTGGFDIKGIYWDYGDTPITNSAGKFVEFDSKTQDIDKLRIANCRFRNNFPLLVISTAGVNPYYVNEMEVLWNIVENRSGLARIHQGRFRTVYYIGNKVDCANGLSFTVGGGWTGGIASGYGGIVHGFIANDMLSTTLDSEEPGEVFCYWNKIRNIKPRSSPGTPGNYAIQIQAAKAHIEGNTAEKVYPFFGTDYTGEALFTGNGSTTTFAGTLAHFPTPDSLKVIAGGVVVADDNDHGWARGGNDGVSAPAVGAYQFGKSRQKIVGTGATGWVDYNSGLWSLTFTTAPSNGVAYTATYFQGGLTSDVEAIYAKSNFVRMIGNSIFDCSNNQGALAPKGNGSRAWVHYPVNDYEGGGGAQYGAILTGNVVQNRVQTGCFAAARGVWAQQDSIIITNNIFEGMCDHIVRAEGADLLQKGLNFIFKNNIIRNHYGSVLASHIRDFENIVIGDNLIDGWPGPATTSWHYIARFTASLGTRIRNAHVSGMVPSEGNDQLPFDTQTANFTVGKTVVGGTSSATGLIMSQIDSGTTGFLRLENITGTFLDNEVITDRNFDGSPAGGSALVNGTLVRRPTMAVYIDNNIATGAGYCDVVLDGFKSLRPWYGVHKWGSGTGGRFRAQNYCTENLVAMELLNEGAASIANMTDDSGYA